MIHALGERRPSFNGHGHFVADSADVIGSVSFGEKSSVWFNAVVRGDNDTIAIGACSNIQDGAVLHTDPGFALAVGNNVTVGHRATLHGCSIGNNTLIGIGATILNNAVVGANCIVGAHALITEGKEFPDGVLIVGMPARVSRKLRSDELAMIASAASTYVEKAVFYRDRLAAV